jgi:type IV secretory pathway VirB9-like protein
MNDQKKMNESYQYQYQYVTEDRSRTYDMQNQDNSDMASDNVDYPSDFIDGWRTMVKKRERERVCQVGQLNLTVNNLEFRDYFK